MDLQTFESERVLHTEETQVVSERGIPLPGRLTLTDRRLVIAWESPRTLRAPEPRERSVRLADVTDARTPGGPLLQVVERSGGLVSLQTFHPLRLRQAILQAVADARAGNVTTGSPLTEADGPPSAAGQYALHVTPPVESSRTHVADSPPSTGQYASPEGPADHALPASSAAATEHPPGNAQAPPHASSSQSPATGATEHAKRNAQVPCPRCRASIPADARFCPFCSQYLATDHAYCRACAAEFPALYTYCTRCGARLAQPGDLAAKSR